MTPGDDNISDPKLWRLIGQVETGVAQVSDKVDNLSKWVKDVGDKVDNLRGNTVKVRDCNETHDKQDRINKSLLAKITKQTRPENPIVGSNTGEIIISPVKGWLGLIKDRVVSLAMIIGAVAAIGTGFWWLAKRVVAIDTVLTENQKKQTEAIKKIENKVDKPKYIYVQVPTPIVPVLERTKRVRKR